MVERSGILIHVAVYGSVADGCTGLVHTYGMFNSANFVECLKTVRKKRSKTTPITCNAQPHKSKKVRRYAGIRPPPPQIRFCQARTRTQDPAAGHDWPRRGGGGGGG